MIPFGSYYRDPCLWFLLLTTCGDPFTAVTRVQIPSGTPIIAIFLGVLASERRPGKDVCRRNYACTEYIPWKPPTLSCANTMSANSTGAFRFRPGNVALPLCAARARIWT